MIVWLASFPRSGNTFLRTILFKAFGLRSFSFYPAKVAERVTAVIGHRESNGPLDLRALSIAPDLALIKTHELPIDNNKAIYILRDGRAALASYYYFHKNVLHIDVRLQDLIAGTKGAGLWSTHVNAWYPDGSSETLLLRFEEVTAEPQRAIEIISKFLEIDPISLDVPSFKQLHNLAPVFFKVGNDNSWASAFTENDLALFERLNGDAMRRFGYFH
ncbi:MAG: sulfotransferase domain-containing protein [Bacteroidota bacterium]